MLYSFQTSLPRLPVPAVKDTVSRVGMIHTHAEMPVSLGSMFLSNCDHKLQSLFFVISLQSLLYGYYNNVPRLLATVLSQARQVFC